jgi:hypothetical protein
MLPRGPALQSLIDGQVSFVLEMLCKVKICAYKSSCAADETKLHVLQLAPGVPFARRI